MTATVAGIHLAGDHASRPAGNAVPDGSLYSCSTHSLIYQSNFAGNSWATWATLGGSGDVATDAIWDAAGDLAVGTGANTAAKLAKGSDGDVLTISASTHVPVWAAPAAPAASSYETVITGMSGLVHRWKFEEASSNFADSVGALTLTVSGSAFTYSVAGGPVSGASGSVTFGATSTATTSGAGSIPTGANARTIVLVAKGTGSTTKECLWSYGALSSRNWFTAMLNDGASARLNLDTYGDDLQWVNAPSALSMWHLIAMGTDGSSNILVWCDGQLQTKAEGGALNTSSSNFQIGKDGSSDQLSAWTFDDLAVFNRLLSMVELQKLLNALG